MPNVYPPMREWRFQTTPLMSTYSVGVFMGEWDRVERKTRNGAVVRVWTPLGRSADGEAACEWAARTIDFFDEYFALPYPLRKLDLVPIEDFPAHGRDSWGVIAFARRSLMVSPQSSATTLRTMRRIVAQTIAHQWFGDLVTPRFWDSLWLKEGFAEYLGFLACTTLDPEGAWPEQAMFKQYEGKQFDALPSTHALESSVSNSGEAAEVFDHLLHKVREKRNTSLLRLKLTFFLVFFRARPFLQPLLLMWGLKAFVPDFASTSISTSSRTPRPLISGLRLERHPLPLDLL